MEQVFLFVLNNAITVSTLIIAIIMVRALGKKMPKWITCMLWMIVAVKLTVPVQFESVMSLMPTGKPIPTNIITENNPQINSGISSSVNSLQIFFRIGALVWLTGVILMLTYAVATYVLIRKRVSVSVKIDSKVYECDDISDSFILGIISPRVYLPSALSEEARKYILKHEFAHLSRYDHLWKPLGFLILSVYWFNPLCWIAYILLCKDIEYACDEKVTKNIEKDEKAEYCKILLENSMPRKMIAACPVAFGETDVKNRIKNVVNYKSPAFWITIASIMVCAGVGVCFATNKSLKPVNEQQVAETEQVHKTEQDNKFIAVADVADEAASNVSAPEESGWIGIVKTPDGVLKVRSAPNADSENIGYVASDEEVQIIEEVDGWYKIITSDGEGYVDGEYVDSNK